MPNMEKSSKSLARGFIAAGVKPGEVVAIFLPNSWEFCAAYHAATLAGAIPTLLNPTYREREVRYQMENSGAVILITDGGNIEGINLAGLPDLRRVYTTRHPAPGAEPFANLLRAGDRRWSQAGSIFRTNSCRASLFQRHHRPAQGRHALALQSGRERVSVARSEFDLVQCERQYSLLPSALPHLRPECGSQSRADCWARSLILVPRFNVPMLTKLLIDEAVTMMPLVPPALNALCQAAEAGRVSSRSSSSLGQIRSRAARSRSCPPLHRSYQHSGVPGIRHDRGLARHPRWFPRA